MGDTPAVLLSPGLAEPHEGALVGRYRIEGLLGEGGMARVYALRHVDHGHRAALKLPKLGLDAEFRDRFLLEAGAHLNLTGKRHIVSPLETGTLPDGRPYLIMQWVEGLTLEAFMRAPERAKEDKEFQLARSLRFCIQVAMALGEAHKLKPPIVHRDLKPSNVYVMTNDEVAIEGREVEYVLLGDFGLAWRRGDKVSAVGTPEYCSPEQAADEPPTVRSDFYSLGVMLYELIEGRIPFQHDDLVTLLGMHRSAPVPPLTNPLVKDNPSLLGLLDKLLAKRWDQRPNDTREIINGLSSALLRLEGRDQATAVKRVPGLESPPTERLPKLLRAPLPPVVSPNDRATSPSLTALQRDLAGRTRRRVAIASVAVLLVGGVVFVATRPEPVVEPVPEPVVVAPPVLKPVEPPPPPPVEPPKVDPSLEELSPVGPAVKKPVRVEAKLPDCEPTMAWKKLMFGSLAALEREAAKAEVDVTDQSQKVGEAIDRAQSPRDCARAVAQFEALRTRVIK